MRNLLLAHGSPHSAHAEQVNRLAEQVSNLLGHVVNVTFLDHAEIPNGARVLPLFLGEGKHVREDIPALMAQSDAIWLPSLSAHADALADMTMHHLASSFPDAAPIFVFYRPRHIAALSQALSQKMTARGDTKHAVTALYGADPTLSTLLQDWQQQAIRPAVLQPMLLFAGHSLDALQQENAQHGAALPISSVLCDCEGFAPLIAQCFRAGGTQKNIATDTETRYLKENWKPL